MPRRAVTNVTDIPVDILCRLITDPDSYGELIDGWRNAKGDAIRDRQRADEAARIADRKELAAKAREDAVAEREGKAAEQEDANALRTADLDESATAVAAKETEASDREVEVSRREIEVEEKVKRLRGDIAALKEL